MWALVKNETEKFLVSKLNYTFIVFLLLLVTFITIKEYNIQQSDVSWKEEAQLKIIENEEIINNKDLTDSLKVYAINENVGLSYSLENNININDYSVWRVTKSAMPLFIIIVLFTISLSSSLYYDEINKKTIFNLNVSPVGKSKIIYGKIIFLSIIVTILTFLVFVSSLIGGFIISNTYNLNLSSVSVIDGTIVDSNIGLNLISTYLLHNIELIIIATLTLVLTVILNNKAISVSIMVVALLFGERINNSFWEDYIIFSKLNLVKYLENIDTKLISLDLIQSFGIIVFSLMILIYVCIQMFKRREYN